MESGEPRAEEAGRICVNHFNELTIHPVGRVVVLEGSRQKKGMMIRATRKLTEDRFQDQMEAERCLGLSANSTGVEVQEQGCVPWQGGQVSHMYRSLDGTHT